MHAGIPWAFLTLVAVAIGVVPTIQDSGHRWLAWWVIIPPLVAGVLAACARSGVS